MRLSPELRKELLAPWPTRGKLARELILVDGDSPPTPGHREGWTEWRHGKARKYHRAEYWLTVGIGWLADQYPVGAAIATLMDTPLKPDWRDLFREQAPRFTGGSLDPEEDELLYAD